MKLNTCKILKSGCLINQSFDFFLFVFGTYFLLQTAYNVESLWKFNASAWSSITSENSVSFKVVSVEALMRMTDTVWSLNFISATTICKCTLWTFYVTIVQNHFFWLLKLLFLELEYCFTTFLKTFWTFFIWLLVEFCL